MLNDKELLKMDDGFYKSYIVEFIEFKRGKGEKVAHSTLIRLRALNNQLNDFGKVEITSSIIDQLLKPKSSEQPQSRLLRVSDLRQFLIFLNAQGIKCSAVPKKYMKSVRSKFHPYIFTDEELIKLAQVADKLPSGKRSNNHQIVYPILIRLLIGTGMRISEVLSLKKIDVDSQNGIIRINNSKNNIARYIPLSNSLSEALRNYEQHIIFHDLNSPYLVSPYTNTFYSYDAVKYMFPKLCSMAGIYRLNGKTPNIHSLRHTFCTKSLEQMLSSGLELYVALPILSAYVGHVNLSDTEVYITLTHRDHNNFINSELSLKTLIPEVNIDE